METERYFETAACLEEQHRQAALEQHQRQLRVQRPPAGFNMEAPECVCGMPIPRARVALGYYNCVDCQTRIEKQHGY